LSRQATLIRLEARGAPNPFMVYLTPILAIALTLLAGIALFAALGFAPFAVLETYFASPLSTTYGLSELGVKATPILLCALGLSLCFRANVWNIGAEGQLVLGAITGGGVGIWFHDSDSVLLLPAMLAAGTLGGALWAGIPALLKTRFNTNEILTSLMLVYVAGLLLSFLVHGPWRDPDGYNFPESRILSDAGTLAVLLGGTRLHIGAAIAVAATLIVWLLFARHFVGFQIKVLGLTPRAAAYAGFNRDRLTWLTLIVSGGLAGLAGVIEVAGPIGQLLPEVSPGYGFTAIIVAFLGRLHPVGILLASLLMALSYLGGEAAQIVHGLPLAVTGVFQGMILFLLLATDVLVHYRIRWGRGGRPGAKL
jgi:simple sugar transport system permease protein